MVRTSEYTSEYFIVVLGAACRFWSHIICRTKHFSPLITGRSHEAFPELVLRTTLTWRPLLGRLSMFSNWSTLSWLSFSEVFFSWPNNIIKVFHEDFQVVFLQGEKTWTYLRTWLFLSGVSSKCFLAIPLQMNIEYESCEQMGCKVFLHFIISSVPSRGIMFLFYCVQTLNSLLLSYKWRPYVKSVLSSAQENRWRRLFINVQWNCSKQEIYRLTNE